MSEKESVPHDIVELLIKEVTSTIKDLGGDIETCSTNIVALANKIDLANINDLDRKVEDIQRTVVDMKENIKESKKTTAKMENALFKTIPRIIVIIGVILGAISYFGVMYKVGNMIEVSQKSTKQEISQEFNGIFNRLDSIISENKKLRGTSYRVKERIEVDEKDEIIYKRIRDKNRGKLGNGYE
jgi:regulator of replication initiation timing